MRRELTYRLSFKRIMKLSRTMGGKLFARVWLWLLLACFLLAALLTGVFNPEIERWMIGAGLPDWPDLPFATCLVLFFAGIWRIRRLNASRIRTRANFDSEIRMTQEEGGLRFATDAIEYYVKWNGIAQMLVEPDGVVISHGNLFWLIPDTAFADAADRRAFIQEVYGRLGESARARSEKYIRPALAA